MACAMVAMALLAGCETASSTSPTPAAKVSARPPASPVAAPAERPVEAPWYRAEIAFEGGRALPFFVQVPPAGGEIVVNNGAESVSFPVAWQGERFTATGPWNFVSTLVGTRKADGRIEGTWTRETPMWGRVERPFVATPVPAPDRLERIAGGGAPVADVTGAWRLKFKSFPLGKGELVMASDGSVTGYVRMGGLPDLRLMAGELQGNTLTLSYFNLNAANVVTATVAPDGMSLQGEVTVQDVFHESFTASKVDDWEYTSKVKLKPGKTRLSVPALDKYRGKPVVLVLGSTWCPACHDMYPFLVQLHAKYKDRGLAFVSLTYDLTDDVATIEAALDAFRKRYHVDWEMFAVPTTLVRWAADMPPEIGTWDGLPLIAFIRADGTVLTIYGGWFNEGSADNVKLKAQFERWAAELVTPGPDPLSHTAAPAR